MRPERDEVQGVSRRRFLRGVGACVALPLFESLRPVLAAAEGGPARPPGRPPTPPPGGHAPPPSP